MASITELLGRDIVHKSDYVRAVAGDLDTVEGLTNYKLALFHRLITSPGSLIHRPNYGVGLKDFQNSPSTLGAQRQLAIRIKDQFELDPRTDEVLGVRYDVSDSEPEKTLIIVRVRPVGYDELEATFIPFGEGVA
jgi:hypothetical protein